MKLLNQPPSIASAKVK